MSCSASSSDRKERALASLLAAALVFGIPTPIFAGEEFSSADAAIQVTDGLIDNSIAGETTITSFVEDGLTIWQEGIDQPADNTLIFDLLSEDSTHYNQVGGDFGAHLNGQVVSGPNQTIVFLSPYGVFIGAEAQIDVGSLVAVGANVNLDAPGLEGLQLTGPIVNQGLIEATQEILLFGTQVENFGTLSSPAGRVLLYGGDAIRFLDADTIAEGLLDPLSFDGVLRGGGVLNEGELRARDAQLFGERVANHGHIDIRDGTLLVAAGDAVELRRLEDPVVVALPRDSETPANHVERIDYGIDQRGTIDAGDGRVRLAAADALGWGIRQRALDGGEAPSIRAADIEIAGGEHGRVELSGIVDAGALEAGGTGGTIDVTGRQIVLKDATVDASGEAGGGTIQIGGERQGRGELQRAEVVVVDADSEIRADALGDGDGGRVIVFAEGLAHVAGELSATGGVRGGDGGFIETSGLDFLQVLTTPDASAPAGRGGEWLIDPFSISIVANANFCATGQTCLDRAVEQILRPDADVLGLDTILRTVNPSGPGVGTNPNELSADLLVRALASGTSVTLSTEAFDPNQDLPELEGGVATRGDIFVSAPIVIGGRRRGARARGPPSPCWRPGQRRDPGGDPRRCAGRSEHVERNPRPRVPRERSVPARREPRIRRRSAERRRADPGRHPHRRRRARRLGHRHRTAGGHHDRHRRRHRRAHRRQRRPELRHEPVRQPRREPAADDDDGHGHHRGRHDRHPARGR